MVKPKKSDYIRSAVYIGIYLLVISVSAFWLLPDLWIVWGAVVLIGMLLLVGWHQKSTAYRCPNCAHVYQISFLTDLLAPHGIDRQGAWLLLRCPNCGKRQKTQVLKSSETGS